MKKILMLIDVLAIFAIAFASPARADEGGQVVTVDGTGNFIKRQSVSLPQGGDLSVLVESLIAPDGYADVQSAAAECSKYGKKRSWYFSFTRKVIDGEVWLGADIALTSGAGWVCVLSQAGSSNAPQTAYTVNWSW